MRDPLEDAGPLLRRVYAFVAYRVGDGPHAEDITSSTVERALRYRGSFDARRGDPTAWLIGIARHCIADAGQAGEPQLSELPDTATAGHDDRVHARVDLAAAVADLDPRDRELIALRYGADLTARQIADVMEMKPNAVEVALHRALSRLRTLLSADAPARSVAEPAVPRPSADASAP